MSTNPFRRRLNEIQAGRSRRANDPAPAAEAAALAAFFEPLYDVIDQVHLAGIRFEAGAVKSGAAFRRINAGSGIRPVIHVQMDARRDLLIQVVDTDGTLFYDCTVRELASVASHARTADVAVVTQWLADAIEADYARRQGHTQRPPTQRFRSGDRPSNERRPDQPATDDWGTTFGNHPGIGGEPIEPEEREPEPPKPAEPPAPPARPFRSIDLNEET